MNDRDLTHNSVVLIIMATVALMIIAAVAMGCSPAHGSRGCLDRPEAARTWPTKELTRDRDGCWTYMRRGLMPIAAPTIVETPTINETAEVNAKLDLLQRWPTVVSYETKPRIVEAKPLMTVRSVVSVILVVFLTCAVFEVAFGGMTRRRH